MKILLFLAFSLSTFFSDGQIRLNEIQSSNGSTITDDFGDNDDWIELHNPTNGSVEIGGLVFKDQLDTWAIPTGDPSTLIPPGGYFILWADDQEFQGIFHTNFKLASGGEFLGLYESDSVTEIESLTIPALVVNDSYMKCGTGWVQTSNATPLTENICNVGLNESRSFNDLFKIVNLNDRQLEVTILNYFADERTLTIYSSNGKELVKQSLNAQKTVLNLNMLKSKVYFVTISTSSFVYSKKMVLI